MSFWLHDSGIHIVWALHGSADAVTLGEPGARGRREVLFFWLSPPRDAGPITYRYN
jgi:hypothetical protein